MSEQVNLAQYLEGAARRFPDRIAVVDPDGTSCTYAELNDRSARLARFLQSRGVMPGDRVGLLMPKSKLAVTAIFGILKARAAYVPVDCTAPAARIQSIFSDCRVRALFTDACGTRALEGAGADAVPDTMVVAGELPGSLRHAIAWQDALAAEPLTESCSAGPDDLAYILYTSGSTGVPKGVMLTHRNATSFVDWCLSVFQPDENDRFSSHAPFHFDLSILDLYVSLKHGASLHLIAEDLGKSPRELAQFIAKRRLTVWYSTPSILTLLVEFGHLKALDCQSLRLVLFAGEVFPTKHLRALTALWPHPAYYNLYGPTETNVCTFARVPSRIPEERTEPYPIGYACAHCEAEVLDSEKRPVPIGEEGLLYIAGPSLFQGYWNRPQLNAAAFVERDGKRWYSTGDLVRENPDEGYIYVGRRDRMVKRRGFRIELGDIETALYRHADIRDAAVIATGNAEGVKIAAYVVSPERRPSIIELKTFCGQQLPAYMNPDVFCFLDALPRTSTAKTDYQSLLARAENRD